MFFKKESLEQLKMEKEVLNDGIDFRMKRLNTLITEGGSKLQTIYICREISKDYEKLEKLEAKIKKMSV